MASSGYKSIVRIDQPEKNTHGYQVRVCFKKKKYTKFFSDSYNGGLKKALKKAVQYRDWLEKDLGKRRSERPVQTLQRKCRNSTGIVGVLYGLHYTQRRGKPIRTPSYFARWSVDGMPGQKSFSIRKWGKRNAFQMACNVRKQMERQIYGIAG